MSPRSKAAFAYLEALERGERILRLAVGPVIRIAGRHGFADVLRREKAGREVVRVPARGGKHEKRSVVTRWARTEKRHVLDGLRRPLLDVVAARLLARRTAGHEVHVAIEFARGAAALRRARARRRLSALAVRRRGVAVRLGGRGVGRQGVASRFRGVLRYH